VIWIEAGVVHLTPPKKLRSGSSILENRKISREVGKITFSPEFERALIEWNKKDRKIYSEIQGRITKILNEPNIGKPLRYSLKNRRRVHIDSFVLVYEFKEGELRFVDFNHHDKIYKKR